MRQPYRGYGVRVGRWGWLQVSWTQWRLGRGGSDLFAKYYIGPVQWTVWRR